MNIANLTTYVLQLPILAMYDTSKSYEVWGVTEAEKRYLKSLSDEPTILKNEDEPIEVYRIYGRELYVRACDLNEARPKYSNHMILPRVLEHLTFKTIRSIFLNGYEKVTFCSPAMDDTFYNFLARLDIHALQQIRANFEICNEFEDVYHDAHKWFTSEDNIKEILRLQELDTMYIGGFKQYVGIATGIQRSSNPMLFDLDIPKVREHTEKFLSDVFHACCYSPYEIPYKLLQCYENGYNEIPVVIFKNMHYFEHNPVLELDGYLIRTLLTEEFLSNLLMMDNILTIETVVQNSLKPGLATAIVSAK